MSLELFRALTTACQRMDAVEMPHDTDFHVSIAHSPGGGDVRCRMLLHARRAGMKRIAANVHGMQQRFTIIHAVLHERPGVQQEGQGTQSPGSGGRSSAPGARTRGGARASHCSLPPSLPTHTCDT